MKATNTRKGFIIPLIIIAIAAILGYKAFEHKDDLKNSVSTSTSSSTASIQGSSILEYAQTNETSSTNVSTWKTVAAPGGIASFRYPADWTLRGETLTSPIGDMTIVGSYGKGSLPYCDPARCTTLSANGVSYTRSLLTTSTGTTITYIGSKLGFEGSAVVTIPNDSHQVANIALADEIVSTINFKY